MAISSQGAQSNIFDFLRLVLAMMVIATHSYAVLGLEERDLLFRVTGGQMKFSTLAVDSFFIISGFLITSSLFRSASIGHYLVKRVLRIIPAFWAVVVVSTILLGIFVAEDSLSFFTSLQTGRYVANTLLLRIHYHIDEVFAGSAINGSLWTIPYEVCMYLLIIPLFVFRKNGVKWVVVLISFASLYAASISQPSWIAGRSLPAFWLSYSEMARLGTLFLGGSLLSCLEFGKSSWRRFAGGVAGVAIILTLTADIYQYFEYIFLPICLVSLGMSRNRLLSRATARGDFSYGTYLWAFPIQRTLAYYLDFDSPFYLTMATIPVALLFGILSWNLIERHFLKMKDLYPVTTLNAPTLRRFQKYE